MTDEKPARELPLFPINGVTYALLPHIVQNGKSIAANAGYIATTMHLSAQIAALSDDARAEVLAPFIASASTAELCGNLALSVLRERERAESAESRTAIAEADRDKAWSLNRDLNDQLFTALKETGEAQADEAKAAMSLARADARVADCIRMARMGWETALTLAERHDAPARVIFCEQALARIAEMEKR